MFDSKNMFQWLKCLHSKIAVARSYITFILMGKLVLNYACSP